MNWLQIFGWLVILGLLIGVIMTILEGTYMKNSGAIVGLSLGMPIAYLLFISSGSPLRRV